MDDIIKATHPKANANLLSIVFLLRFTLFAIILIDYNIAYIYPFST